MSRVDKLLGAALKSLPPKPNDKAPAPTKKAYSEKVSAVVALALAEELRERGLASARPAAPGVVGLSGAERRMAGGIGAKRVDVTWATEESGLLLALSIKSINFRDRRTGNFQKNLTNRRGDLLYEAVTLHRRFPYSVLGGFLFLDHGAANDDTPTRRSTFVNADSRLRLFDGRQDPSGRDEQFEHLYIVLIDASPKKASWDVFRVGAPETPVSLDEGLNGLVALVAERNPDFYEAHAGTLHSVR